MSKETQANGTEARGGCPFNNPNLVPAPMAPGPRAVDWRRLQRVLDALDEQRTLAEQWGDTEELDHIARQRARYEAKLAATKASLTRDKPPVYYGDYLCLDTLLAAQLPQSEAAGAGHAHDEHLFIVTHQAYELWFKHVLHELACVLTRMARPFLSAASTARVTHHLNRVTAILRLLLQQIDVLETMTPLDFMDFRDHLFPASGFQSVQFRLIENVLGLESKRRLLHDKLPYHARLSSEHAEQVIHSEQQPTLFELVERWLERTPFTRQGQFDFWTTYRTAVAAMFDADQRTYLHSRHPPLQEGDELPAEVERELAKLRDNRTAFLSLFDEEQYKEQQRKGLKRLSFNATQAALLIYLYQDEPMMIGPFHLLQCLIDIDAQLTAWRFKHAMMVQRMLGTKIGTGGSSGYWYLRDSVSRGRIFQDIADLATFLIPRKALPPLPESVAEQLRFSFESSALQQHPLLDAHGAPNGSVLNSSTNSHATPAPPQQS